MSLVAKALFPSFLMEAEFGFGDLAVCECGHSIIHHERVIEIKPKKDCFVCHCEDFNQMDWIGGYCEVPKQIRS